MLSDCVSLLAYPNLFGIKGFVVVVVIFSFLGGSIRYCIIEVHWSSIYFWVYGSTENNPFVLKVAAKLNHLILTVSH
jgi:hypothetical protein